MFEDFAKRLATCSCFLGLMMKSVIGMEDQGLILKDSARFDYAKGPDDIISNVHPGRDIENRWRKSLIPVRDILLKTTISVEEYEQIGLELRRCMLFFSSEGSFVLDKLLVFSSISLLKKGVNDLVGSSFYPQNEALEAVFLDEKNLTRDEFCYLFLFLAKKTNDEKYFPIAFLEEALDNIREKREK